MSFAARTVRRASSQGRKFSTMFESKNKIPEVRQKYYSNPAVGKKNAIPPFFALEADVLRECAEQLTATVPARRRRQRILGIFAAVVTTPPLFFYPVVSGCA